MATPNIVPRADSEGGIGTASKYWASAYIDLIYVGAGKMGRDADNLFDFSVDNEITFRVNATDEMVLNDSSLSPHANRGLSLGTSALRWKDLHLGDAAVINFNNHNVTLTHSNNALTLADGDALHFGTDNDLRLFHTSGESLIQNTVGHLYIQNTADDKDIIFSSDDGSGGVTTYFKLSGVTSKTIFSKTLNLQDSVSLYLGTGNDLQLVHNSTNSEIVNATGNLTIKNNTDDGDIIFSCDDGSGGTTEYFRLDGGIKRTIFTENIGLEDNTQILIGSGNDLQIYHDATDSFIKNSHGNLVFRNNKQNKDILFQGDDGQASDDTIATYFYLDGSSAAHNGSATTALYTNWPDNSRISLGTSHDLTIHHSGTSSAFANAVGHLEFIQSATDADIKFYCDDGSGGIETYFYLDGSANSGNLPITVFPDNSKLTFGNGYDLRIVHDGVNSVIQSLVGKFQITSLSDDLEFTQFGNDKDINFSSDDGSGGTATYFRLDGGEGHMIAYKELNFADGVPATFGNTAGGDLEIKEQSGSSYILNHTGNLQIQNHQDNGDIVFSCDDGSGGVETYFYLDGSVGGSDPVTRFPDAAQLQFGSGGDAFVKHSGTDFEIGNSTGTFAITQYLDDGDIIFKCDDGSGGVTPYLTLDGGVNQIHIAKETIFADAILASFGADRDLRIQHSGSNSFIDNYTGTLNFRQRVDDGDIVFSCDDGSGGDTAYLTLDGGATAIVADKSIYMADNKRFYAGGGGDLGIYHDGTNSYINNATGNLQIKNSTDDGDIEFVCDDGSGGNATYLTLDGGDEQIKVSKNLKFHDNVQAWFGGGNDLRIYHDGSNSFIVDQGTGNLWLGSDGNFVGLGNSSASESYLKAHNNGSVELYHDNSKKLETTSAGVDVTGTVSATSYKTGSTTVLQGDADVILGSSGSTGTISLTTHTSVPFKIENDDSISMSPAKIVMTNLPTSDPGTTGQLWNDNGTLKISAGG